MSDLHPDVHHGSRRKLAGSREECRLARPLHAALFVVLSGCIIPPTLGIEQQDAGINSPPAITSVRSDQQELTDGLTVSFTAHARATLAMDLLDTDTDETLYVRVFVDYSQLNPTPPRASCVAATSGTAKRSATCDITGLCQDADVGKVRLMTVEVFDRMPLDSGDPLYKAMPAGGLTTSRAFLLACLSQ